MCEHPQGAAALPDPGAADYAAMVDRVARNYAGYRPKTAGREAWIADCTRALRKPACRAQSASERAEALGRWLALFDDRHLWVRAIDGQSGTGAPEPPSSAANAPTLTFTPAYAHLRVPSFDLTWAAPLTRLIQGARERLATTDALILDVRGNVGGADSTFAPILPLLYTRPMRVIGTDLWASDDNAAHVRSLVDLDEIPDAVKAGLRAILERTQRQPNTFVPLSADAVLRQGTVHLRPRRVALLYDRRTASAAEQFLLLARQSDKVVFFARSCSAGVLDYSNVCAAPLPSGEIELGVPTSRSRRLPLAPVDGVGIGPDVRIPDEAPDDLDYVRTVLTPP